MSGAREQVSRLLALVPYLQTRTDVSLAQAAADFGGAPRADHEGPQGPLDVRAPGADTGQDDRGRLRGDRGRSRRRRTHRQRGLPRPAGPARQLRGVGPDRGPACPPRGQPGGVPRGHRPVPGQARGRHGERDGASPGRAAPASVGPRPAPCHGPGRGDPHQPAGPPRLLRPHPGRDHETHGRPAGAAQQRGTRLPRRLVPPRPGPPAVPAGPDACRGDRRRAAPGARPDAPRPRPKDSSSRGRTTSRP